MPTSVQKLEQVYCPLKTQSSARSVSTVRLSSSATVTQLKIFPCFQTSIIMLNMSSSYFRTDRLYDLNYLKVVVSQQVNWEARLRVEAEEKLHRWIHATCQTPPCSHPATITESTWKVTLSCLMSCQPKMPLKMGDKLLHLKTKLLLHPRLS